MSKNKKIKVVLVAPAFGDTGGPEVVTKNLTEALSQEGIDVTLFAPGDWKTKLKHIPTLKQSLWNMKNFKQQTEIERRNLITYSQLKVLKYANQFDIIHLNLQRHAYPIVKISPRPCVLTFHSKIVPEEFKQIKEAGAYTVALSKKHKKNLAISAVIPNGINTEEIEYSLKKGKYLVVIGRLLESKGIDTAIKIALKSKKNLIILGRIGSAKSRQDYYNNKIKPFVDNKQIIHKGEVSQEKVFYYLKNAEALLFPYRPNAKALTVCPLTVMESLACGTPVIGTPINPMPEPLKDSSVACLSNNINILIKAVKSIDKFDRNKCRKYAEKYFDRSIMAKKYITLYEKILKNK